MRFYKILKWIEKVWDLPNILVPNSKFFKRKSSCKSAFRNKLFADVSNPAGYCVPSGPWNYICSVHVCCVVPYAPCQTTEKRREMLEMIRTEMSRIILYFKPKETSKLLSRSVIGNENLFKFMEHDLRCGFLTISRLS